MCVSCPSKFAAAAGSRAAWLCHSYSGLLVLSSCSLVTDDVGQSLLNWASAFGTLEMVEFLIDSGADVDAGQRSTSLHYAASFGRADIVKELLRKGANPDLKDEDGKTPLEKAQGRSEPGHQEVVTILENPEEVRH